MQKVNYRVCLHERKFTVKTKRGDINTYCSDCFKWLWPPTIREKADLRKQRKEGNK